MFGFLRWFGAPEDHDNLLSSSIAPVLTQMHLVYAPGTKIPYDPRLISRLKDDHQILMRLFTAVVTHAKEGRIDRCLGALEQFENTLNGNLLLEFTKL